MSTFNRFCNNVKNTFKKISDKTEELFDSAANSVKIKNLEMKIDEQYENAPFGISVYVDWSTIFSIPEFKNVFGRVLIPAGIITVFKAVQP